MKIQPAVKKETGHIACWSGAGTILMIVAFAICHKLFPEAIPFDHKVIIGGIIGTAVAVGNFFIMGLTVQKIASGEQSDEQGFCQKHLEMLYEYPNKLGLAMMLKTHMDKTAKELKKAMKAPLPQAAGLFRKKSQTVHPVITFVEEKEK